MTGNELSLYYHIPFCTRKCDYCHFYVLPNKESLKDELFEGFQLEWERWTSTISQYSIPSVYFGGGTPALFGPERIAALIKTIHVAGKLDPQAEITLEANPENITYELMDAYRKAGINRVSIGVQSLSDELLKVLTRTHGAQKALDAVQACHAAGIKNISIDLMYDIPHQTSDQWNETLEKTVALPITHLSLYNLTFERHTVYFKKQQWLKKAVPNEELSLQMYKNAVDKFEQSGLHRYEISAFARAGNYSRHNVGYWTGRQFLGFGPSAFSYYDGKRFRNVSNQSKYIKALKENLSPIDFEEELDPAAKARELFVIRMRLKEGCDLNQFALDPETLKTVNRLISEGYLEQQTQQVKLTDKGILFYDTVASELV